MELFIARIFDGFANGATYGLIALALVLIYKATTLINFAQGEMAMFGAFIVLVLATVVSYYYYLRLAWFTWMREPARADQHDGVFIPLSTRVALAASVGIVLFLGIFPGAFLEFARTSVEGIAGVGGVFLSSMP